MSPTSVWGAGIYNIAPRLELSIWCLRRLCIAGTFCPVPSKYNPVNRSSPEAEGQMTVSYTLVVVCKPSALMDIRGVVALAVGIEASIEETVSLSLRMS